MLTTLNNEEGQPQYDIHGSVFCVSVARMGRKYGCWVIGECGVGKSSIVIQMVEGIFVEEYDPTIEHTYRTQCCFAEEPCTLDIVDFAPIEEYFCEIQDRPYRQSDGLIYVFSITDNSSFVHVQSLHSRAQKYRDDIPAVLAGNKTDLASQRQVSSEQGAELAAQWNCRYLECSAKTRTNIEELFYYLYLDIKAKEPVQQDVGRKQPRTCILS